MKNRIFLLFIVTFSICKAQDIPIDSLQEVVVIANKRLQLNSKTYKVTSLNDSIITNNLESFTSLLRFNAPIYFKEYSKGGTSSASFRGTSASNTAVMWNGINVNSVNNGQTDFNSLNVSLYDVVDVRSGGGSIEYGSGAVGGTVHLSDILQFSTDNGFKNELVTSLGSFSTYSALYKTKYASKKLAFKFGAAYNISQNDYELLGHGLKNENGGYSNLNFNFAFGYKFTKRSKLNLYSTNYLANRLLSGELPNPSAAKEKYKDFNNRNLLVFNFEGQQLNHEIKAGFLTQEYQYFADKNNDSYNYGASKNYLVDYHLDVKLPSIHGLITFNSLYESVFGKTDRIKEKNRRQFSQSILYNQTFEDKLFFDIKLRKDFNSDYKVPLSYALGFKLELLKHLFLRTNTSQNYRVPSYNDLYWPGQGNENLIPETSLQGEFGILFRDKKIKLDVAYFTIFSKDKIVWTPNGNSDRPGVWTPVNLSKSTNRGIEFSMNYQTKILNNHSLLFTTNYTYVSAKDEENDTYLIFVPKHILNASSGYSYRRFNFFYQLLINDQVYTTDSNSNEYRIPAFWLSNVGINYKLIREGSQQVTVGTKINNVFDKAYQITTGRLMPNRNFNININYKF